jgi:hypothetical protein
MHGGTELKTLVEILGPFVEALAQSAEDHSFRDAPETLTVIDAHERA